MDLRFTHITNGRQYGYMYIVRCTALQCVAACFSVQCVAACCSPSECRIYRSTKALHLRKIAAQSLMSLKCGDCLLLINVNLWQSAKKPHLSANEHYTSAKEQYILAEELCISKMRRFCFPDRLGFVISVATPIYIIYIYTSYIYICISY